jgi:hypothetical protein
MKKIRKNLLNPHTVFLPHQNLYLIPKKTYFVSKL